MNRLILLLLVLAVYAARGQQITEDPVNAFLSAKQSGKKVLLVFSGSDWCLPCIRFEKKILSDSSFRQLASGLLVVLMADFPQHKKIPDTLRIQYEALSEQFNPSGDFPRIVLLDADKRFLAVLVYAGQSSRDFIREMRELLK
jgi:thioredoxin-related protein